MKGFKKFMYKAYNNVFGKMGGAFVYAGILGVCCNALALGATMLALGGTSLIICICDIAAKDHEMAQLDKYFPEPEVEEYKSTEKVNTKELVAENQETAEVKEQEVVNDKKQTKTVKEDEMTR